MSDAQSYIVRGPRWVRYNGDEYRRLVSLGWTADFVGLVPEFAEPLGPEKQFAHMVFIPEEPTR